MDLRRRLIPVLLVGLAVAGCKKKDVPQAAQPAETAPPPVEAPPVDALLPSELAEGDEKAFGIRLPRTTLVEKRFDDAVFGYGAYSTEEASKYFLRRLDEGKFVPSTARTILRGKARAAGLNQPMLQVEVFSSGGNAHFVIRDVTAPPMEPNLTDEERWRRAGIGKDGQSTVKE